MKIILAEGKINKIEEKLDRIIELLEEIAIEVETPRTKEMKYYQQEQDRKNAERLKERLAV